MVGMGCSSKVRFMVTRSCLLSWGGYNLSGSLYRMRIRCIHLFSSVCPLTEVLLHLFRLCFPMVPI